MDWQSLITALLLLIFISGETVAAGRKKIRIHIPQKVKHIHHHKKIYITKEQASTSASEPIEQYAPAFLGGEGTALALLPLAGERTSAPKAPNLQPQYRARGHYGPPPVYREPKQRRAKARPSTSKRVKILTVSEPRKKVVLKKKNKRIIITEPRFPEHKAVGTNPSFPEDFYQEADHGEETFTPKRKPKRVEKYVDGDTEHIHTFSEEHIHQIVYDNPPEGGQPEGLEAAAIPFYGKPSALPPPRSLLPLDVALHHAMQASPTLPSHTVVTGIHPSVSTIIHPVISGNFKPSYSDGLQQSMSHPIHTIHVGPRPLDVLETMSSNTHKSPIISQIGAVGSLGTPAHMEYMNYNPFEASHEHHYHDHGKVIMEQGINHPVLPSKATFYHEMRPNQPPKHRPHGYKSSWVSQDSPNKSNEFTDFNHFDGLITHNNQKKRPSKYSFDFEDAPNSEYNFEEQIEDFPHTHKFHSFGREKVKKVKPVSRIKSISNNKKSKHNPKIHLHLSIDSKPISTAASYLEEESYKSFRDSPRIKDTSSPSYSNYQSSFEPSSFDREKDAYALSSNNNHHENNFSAPGYQRRNKSKKKSISTTSVNFGGQDHTSVIDHMAEGSNISPTIDTTFSDISRKLPEDKYLSVEDNFSVMSSKSFEASQQVQDASNTNLQVVQAPILREMEPIIVETTTSSLVPSTSTDHVLTTTSKIQRKQKKKHVEDKKLTRENDFRKGRGKFRYGERLNERHEVEN